MVALFVLASGPGMAVVVSDLYEAEVPVSDHGQKALAAASLVALSEVLVKVSGSVDILQNPAIVPELGRARSYVRQYSYTRDEDAEGDLAARFNVMSIPTIIVFKGGEVVGQRVGAVPRPAIEELFKELV